MPAYWSFVKHLLLRDWYLDVRRLRTRHRRPNPFARLDLEKLEVRLVPASYFWTGGAGTLNWGDKGNWSGTVVPGSGDDVTINVAVSGPITISGTQAVNSLTDTTAALVESSGSFTLTAASSVSKNFTLTSGTLTANGGLTQTSATFTFNGGSIGGTVTLLNSAAGHRRRLDGGGQLRPRGVRHADRERGGGAVAVGAGQQRRR